ncbi:LysM peptidoglycan-binding domain-containing protein [Brevibacillus sp. SYP-B805]|uniref:cell division suppressor protein YneA n=1 Tax=Brevibacillus sp. SYP-B805 TaxID=1578199 RepID=UPI0013EB1503|nr:LysM peptidoglycan-binding domain-containing protein [Brevibacillus sp. SYP-B805]NGQ96356.1 LysM peptidoglycan-binding domain-containing protein [Brevibacillus sp. SYP-B805]
MRRIAREPYRYRGVCTQAPSGKGRITRGQALLILLAFCFCTYLLSGFVFAADAGKEGVSYQLVTVQKGDSLWTLAERYHDQSCTDIRDFVDKLIEINQLHDVTIYPGQNLKIPVSS